jgi:hypothetical protein
MRPLPAGFWERGLWWRENRSLRDTVTGVRISGRSFACWVRSWTRLNVGTDWITTVHSRTHKSQEHHFIWPGIETFKRVIVKCTGQQTGRTSSCVIVYWNETNTLWGMRVITDSDSVQRVYLICIHRTRKCSPVADRHVWYRNSPVGQEWRSIRRIIQNSRDTTSEIWCRVAMCPFLRTRIMDSNRPTESYQTTLCLQQVMYEVGYNGKAIVNDE